MICPTCRTTNPDDAHFCSHCGVRVEHTDSRGVIAGLVDANEGRTDPAPPSTPEPARRNPDGLPTVAPPTIGEPGPPSPVPPAIAPTMRFPQSPVGGPTPVDTTTMPRDTAPAAAPLLAETARSSALPIVAVVAALLAVVGTGAFLLLRDTADTADPEVIVTPTDQPVPSTPTSGAPPDTPAVTVAVVGTVPAGTGVADADPAATAPTDPTAPAPTAPASTGPPPTVGDPAAIPPPPEEPGPVNAPGSPQVLSVVQPSGPTYAEVEVAFTIAQEFADALALEDWTRARRLSPELAGNSDDDFARGYANTNRVSLILRDARPDGNSYELLVVSVAVENGGAQTSLFCLNWAVDPAAGTLDQRGGRKLATWAANAQPEAIRNDAAALDVVNSCTYP